MRRFGQVGSFDEQSIPEMNSEVLDFRAASEFFAPVRKLTPSAFRSLHITTKYQGRDVPTVGGYLLFGKNRSRLADSTEIRSHLPQAAEEAIEFVQKHMSREAVIGPIRRMDRWTVPLVAVREAIINAIVHADYAERGSPIRVAIFDDRVEVENPGLLPLGLTIEDIRKGVSKLRNRVIGRVFHELGLIEQWGSGIQRMTAACQEAGLPAPGLEEFGAHFRVIISTIPTGPVLLDEKDQTILRFLGDRRGRSTAQIAKGIAISARATRTRLAHLVQRGLVVEVGSGPQDPRRQYFRCESDKME